MNEERKREIEQLLTQCEKTNKIDCWVTVTGKILSIKTGYHSSKHSIVGKLPDHMIKIELAKPDVRKEIAQLLALADTSFYSPELEELYRRALKGLLLCYADMLEKYGEYAISLRNTIINAIVNVAKNK